MSMTLKTFRAIIDKAMTLPACNVRVNQYDIGFQKNKACIDFSNLESSIVEFKKIEQSFKKDHAYWQVVARYFKTTTGSELPVSMLVNPVISLGALGTKILHTKKVFAFSKGKTVLEIAKIAKVNFTSGETFLLIGELYFWSRFGALLGAMASPERDTGLARRYVNGLKGGRYSFLLEMTKRDLRAYYLVENVFDEVNSSFNASGPSSIILNKLEMGHSFVGGGGNA